MHRQPSGPPPETPEPPPGQPPEPPTEEHQPASPIWRRRPFLITAAAAAVVIALVIVLVVALAPSGPLTVTGTVSSTTLSLLNQDPGSCILNLPDSGDQLLMKADGVTVATADLGNIKSQKNSLGEICYVKFTFTGVPAGKTLYEVVINVSNNTALTTNGCTGTVYYKPSQLSKPLALNCS
jgi:hypothetical protein